MKGNKKGRYSYNLPFVKDLSVFLLRESHLGSVNLCKARRVNSTVNTIASRASTLSQTHYSPECLAVMNNLFPFPFTLVL